MCVCVGVDGWVAGSGLSACFVCVCGCGVLHCPCVCLRERVAVERELMSLHLFILVTK